MKIVDIICSAGRTGFYFDDQRAIKQGAGHDGIFYVGAPVTEGFRSIRQETRCIVDKCFELGNGDIAIGVCRAVEAGVLDVPFAPCRANAGLMLPCRDNNGAIRILNMGNLPFTQDLKDYHAAKIEERAKFENRKPSFQMVIDDVYSIGKGRLVGRPR